MKSKLFFGKIKNEASFYYDIIKSELAKNETARVMEKYNVKSFDDLLAFYSEVGAFYMDTSNLNKEERTHIEEKKKDFISRVKDEAFLKDPKKLDKLKNALERIYSDEMTKRIITTSNLGDFPSRTGIALNKKNIKSLYDEYRYLHYYAGLRTIWENVEGKSQSLVIFNDSSFYNKDSTCQNDVIIHEFIHSLENANVKKDNRFCLRARYLNEAITEYFTLESRKYLKNNILNDDEKAKEDKTYLNDYYCMLPLIEPLKESKIWDDIIKAKVDNDYSSIIKKYGSDMIKVCKMFDKVYHRKGYADATKEDIKEVKKLVQKMEKKVDKKSNRLETISF